MLSILDKLENVLQGLKFEKSHGFINNGKPFSYIRNTIGGRPIIHKICFYKVSHETTIGPMSYHKFTVYDNGKLTISSNLRSERTITGIDIFDVPSIILLYGND